MTDRYAVFGHPIAHSRSPQIHQWFAEQTQQDLSYEALLAPLDGFATSARAFFANGGLGANVTLPFKLEALSLADRLSPRAAKAGAVNTLQQGKNGQLYGDNTDGVGLLRDLQQLRGQSLQGQRVLLLGAGGAARGAVQPLLEAQIDQLWIANRTPEKAQQLIAAFTQDAAQTHLQSSDWAGLTGQSFDWVINATSASLEGALPPLPEGLFKANALAYDMMYAAQPTPFMRWAAQAGASQTSDGLGMLVEQAAEAFFLWRQVRPDTDSVKQRLRQQLSAA